ncbi:MAG: bifunctional diaminohydroxyphosphoribosylaminopyrimidine deaminase/5-amino-6-(5-phosphoribosylamino)uracil reductase RibD [Verrucomicrobiota bacterium]
MAVVPQEPDSRWMHLALDQAKRGVGLTSPNPPVGSVIVNQGKIIGQGYHHKAGSPHAEIEALRDAQTYNPKLLPGATLYVTLEPCCTQGRTGPCTEAIKAAGIKRVVWGALDPNPRHAGRAQEILTGAGISVSTGVLDAECRELIRPFSKWVTTGLPYVIAKVGQSLDGRITRPPGEGQWITSESARSHGRRLRARVDAIIVGAGTIRADNPQLTLRDSKSTLKEQPYRVILSRSCNMPEASHVFTDEHKNRTWVLRDLTFVDALKELGQRGIVSVLIEGGADVLGQAFAAQAVDEIVWYIAPRICGSFGLPAIGGVPLASSVEITGVNVMPLGDNVCITGHPVWSKTQAQPAPVQP